MLPPYLLIVFQQLYGMPPHGRMGGIIRLHHYFQFGEFILDVAAIVHHIPFRSFLVMVDHRVQQDIQPRPPCGGNRDDGNVPKHFRQAVQINFHAPFLHNIHHV